MSTEQLAQALRDMAESLRHITPEARETLCKAAEALAQHEAQQAQSINGRKLSPFDAVARAMDTASLLAGAVARNDRGDADAYSARLRSHLVEYIYPAATIAQQAQAAEPVAWRWEHYHTTTGVVVGVWLSESRVQPTQHAMLAGEDFDSGWIGTRVTPLFTAPPVREPLTDEQIVNDGLMMCPMKLLDSCADAFEAGVKYAERAHGIGAAAGGAKE